jgi:hypothetical protein
LERIDFELRSLLSARLVAERDGLVARSTQSRAAHHRTSCALARRASIWEASAVPPYRRFCPIERQKWSVERWKWAVERENTHVERFDGPFFHFDGGVLPFDGPVLAFDGPVLAFDGPVLAFDRTFWPVEEPIKPFETAFRLGGGALVMFEWTVLQEKRHHVAGPRPDRLGPTHRLLISTQLQLGE